MKVCVHGCLQRKRDGTLRVAYGTLAGSVVPVMQSTGRRVNDTVQTYYDTERGVARRTPHQRAPRTDQGFIVPAHIYIYRDEKSEAAIGDTVAPDATIYRPDGEIMTFTSCTDRPTAAWPL